MNLTGYTQTEQAAKRRINRWAWMVVGVFCLVEGGLFGVQAGISFLIGNPGLHDAVRCCLLLGAGIKLIRAAKEDSSF
jgi:hypothetical protein